MNRCVLGLAALANLWVARTTNQISTAPDWRLAAEAGVTLSETPYGGVLITAECEAVAGLSLGLQATGAGKLFDASYGIIPGPLRDPEGGVFSIRTRTRGT